MARPAVDYTGVTWDNWTVLSRDGTIHRNAAWLCRCNCGNEQRIIGPRVAKRESVACLVCEARKLRTRTPYDDYQFVRAWQGSESVPEVAGKLLADNIKQVNSTALRLRKRGVPLKRMPRGGTSNVEHYQQLRALAESLVPPEE